MDKRVQQQPSVGSRHVATLVRIFGFEALYNSGKVLPRELIDALSDLFGTAELLIPEDSKNAPTYPLAIRAYGYDSLLIAGRVFEELTDRTAVETTCRYSTSVLYLASFFQTRLLMEHGLLTKGRVTIGDFYAWNGATCGTAIFNAERGEGSVEYPRIEVDRHVADLFIESAVKMGLANEKEAKFVFVDIDEDSVFIRNPHAQIVLARILQSMGSDLVKFDPLFECMGKNGVQRAIERYEGAFGRDPHVHEMCRWLLDYHNSVASNPPFTEGPIDEAILESPKRGSSISERIRTGIGLQRRKEGRSDRP